jgi:hypothetical protein
MERISPNSPFYVTENGELAVRDRSREAAERMKRITLADIEANNPFLARLRAQKTLCPRSKQ